MQNDAHICTVILKYDNWLLFILSSYFVNFCISYITHLVAIEKFKGSITEYLLSDNVRGTDVQDAID